MRFEERTKIALKLSLLSAFIGEVVSGSSPPLEIINPFTFLFIWAFYGSGVLLVRELWVKWGKSFTSLMLLGVAYGIAEEGLAVKSFFDPNWMDLGKLAEYGRFAGMNFVWAVWLSIFHAVFSISIPILLIQILYPEYRDEALLSPKSLKKVFGIFLFVSLLIFAFLNPYSPPPIQYLLTLLLSIYIVRLASRLKPSCSIPPPKFDFKSKNFQSRRNFLYGLLFTFSMFFLFFIIPETPVPPAIPCILAIYLFLNLYRRLERINIEFNAKQTFTLILGLLTPFLLFFDIILEINGIRGMAVVGIATFIILLTTLKRLSRSEYSRSDSNSEDSNSENKSTKRLG